MVVKLRGVAGVAVILRVMTAVVVILSLMTAVHCSDTECDDCHGGGNT